MMERKDVVQHDDGEKKTKRGEIMKEERLWYFEFSGTWTWGCYASNVEEAKKMFSETSNELNISNPTRIDEYNITGVETYDLD